jgi:hypothetical protein
MYYAIGSPVELLLHKLTDGEVKRKLPFRQATSGQQAPTLNTSIPANLTEASESSSQEEETPEIIRMKLLGATLRTAANALIIGMDLFPGVGYIADTLEAVNWGLRTTSIVYPSFRNFNLTPDMGGKGMMVGLGAQALDFAVLGGMAPGSASSIILHGGQIYYDLGLIKKHIINPLDFLKVGINRLRNRNTDTGEEDTN